MKKLIVTVMAVVAIILLTIAFPVGCKKDKKVSTPQTEMLKQELKHQQEIAAMRKEMRKMSEKNTTTSAQGENTTTSPGPVAVGPVVATKITTTVTNHTKTSVTTGGKRARPIEEVSDEIKFLKEQIRAKEYTLALTRQNLASSCNGPNHGIFLRSCIANLETDLEEMDAKLVKLTSEKSLLAQSP